MPGEKSVPETRSGPSPHQQAIVTAMPGGLPVPKSPNIQQSPAHGMKCSGALGGGERVSPPCPPLAPFAWASGMGGQTIASPKTQRGSQVGGNRGGNEKINKDKERGPRRLKRKRIEEEKES